MTALTNGPRPRTVEGQARGVIRRATDLARLHFVRDIARLERFCIQTEQNGLALILTNDPALWTPPGPGHRPTRDHEFRIQAGVELAGTRRWANGTYEQNTCILDATYRLT